MHKMLFLALKNVGMFKIFPPQIPTSLKKNSPLCKICHSLLPLFNAIWKTLIDIQNYFLLSVRQETFK